MSLLILHPSEQQREARQSPRRNLLWQSYAWLDYRHYRTRVRRDAFAPMTVRDMCKGVTLLALPSDSEPPLACLAGVDLDVLVDLRPAGGRRWPSRAARFGTWQLRPGDDVAAFFAMYRRRPVFRSAIEVASDPQAQTIYCSWAATDPTSAFKNANAACWKAEETLVRRLETLQRTGLPPSPVAGDRLEGMPPRRPSNAETLQLAFGLAKDAVLRKVRERLFRSDWLLGLRHRTWASLRDRPPAGFHPVPMPADHFYADPFLYEAQGRTYVFFEDYRYRSRKAVISCAEVRSDLTLGSIATVLEQDWHLSYPFVFELDGAIYLLPESSQHRSVELYRAVDFPCRWVLDRVLMEGVHAVDTTLFRHAGKLWLLTVLGVEGASDWDDLYLYFSDSLEGPWSPHPRNPIVSDVRRARPAGAVFWDGGALIRPSQDSSRTYGGAIVLNRIDLLSETDYRETPVGRITPDWLPGGIAAHTFSQSSRFEALDGRRRVLRPLSDILWPAAARRGSGTERTKGRSTR